MSLNRFGSLEVPAQSFHLHLEAPAQGVQKTSGQLLVQAERLCWFFWENDKMWVNLRSIWCVWCVKLLKGKKSAKAFCLQHHSAITRPLLITLKLFVKTATSQVSFFHTAQSLKLGIRFTAYPASLPTLTHPLHFAYSSAKSPPGNEALYLYLYL